jgi:hypothetical protein
LEVKAAEQIGEAGIGAEGVIDGSNFEPDRVFAPFLDRLCKPLKRPVFIC